jgi:hypothetical protein
MGIVDEWTNTITLYRLMAEPQGIAMSRNEKLVSPLVLCIANYQLSSAGLTSLIEQHLNVSSTNRHEPMASLVWIALQKRVTSTAEPYAHGPHEGGMACGPLGEGWSVATIHRCGPSFGGREIRTWAWNLS